MIKKLEIDIYFFKKNILKLVNVKRISVCVCLCVSMYIFLYICSVCVCLYICLYM